MPTVPVTKMDGGQAGSLELPASVFEAPINTHCVRAAVNRQLARARLGTASAKGRGEVRGGGAKPWRQKGTGRARAGTSRSPLWRGGSVIFGPQPRSYGGRLNRKVTRTAIISCLSSFAQDGQFTVVETMDMAEPKTRAVVEMLSALKVDGAARVLLLTDETNVNLALGARNLPNVNVINCENLNVYDLTTHDVLIATSSAVKCLEERYA